MQKWFSLLAKTALAAVFVVCLGIVGAAQKTAKPKAAAKPAAVQAAGPSVAQIDIEGLKKLIVPKGKPLMINFWATWCGPCIEEFPDLVRLDNAFKGKIDFITVTLDDPEDIKTRVPAFLRSKKAEMPTYLLVTNDETAAISLITKDWSGALPFTAIFHENGDLMYPHFGKIRYETVQAQIEKLLAPRQAPIEPKE